MFSGIALRTQHGGIHSEMRPCHNPKRFKQKARDPLSETVTELRKKKAEDVRDFAAAQSLYKKLDMRVQLVRNRKENQRRQMAKSQFYARSRGAVYYVREGVAPSRVSAIFALGHIRQLGLVQSPKTVLL